MTVVVVTYVAAAIFKHFLKPKDTTITAVSLNGVCDTVSALYFYSFFHFSSPFGNRSLIYVQRHLKPSVFIIFTGVFSMYQYFLSVVRNCDMRSSSLILKLGRYP